MQLPDAINGGFEFIGGAMNLINCRRLYRDKCVRGVSLLPTMFFTSWGVWNLFYYPNLDQWLSFGGGLVIVAANTLWVVMALHYSRSEPCS